MKPLSPASRRAIFAVLLLAAFGCQTGISPEELPDQPIALVYRTPQESRERAEALIASDPVSQRESQARRKEGVAPVDELRRQATNLMGGATRESEKHAGRMALLDPRTGSISVIEGARRGATPSGWSPDHRRLLFSQLESLYLQLFELDSETGDVRTVSRGPLVHPRGCYGPEGRIVMLTVGVENGQVATRIVATSPGGEPTVRISEGVRDHTPVCAPDGSAVAWVESLERGNPQIWARSPALRGVPRRLTPGREPAFSPDGQWIVYSAPIADTWKLWRIRPDGTGRAPVGGGSLEELRPSVAPDGLYVAYVVENDHRAHLYVRRMDGSGDRILFRDGDGDRPVW